MSCGCGCSGSQINSSDQCAASACGCGGNALPFYNQAGLIQETHCQSMTVVQYAASLSLTMDFVMPAVGGEAIVMFQGLTQIQIGSYLWNATYGYLLVTAFDPYSGEVTVENDGYYNNAAAGTVIPRCSLFNITAPPCDCGCDCSPSASPSTSISASPSASPSAA